MPQAETPEDWYYSQDDERHGPVTFDQLQQLALSGEIGPLDLVIQPGMPEWIRAESIPALSSVWFSPLVRSAMRGFIWAIIVLIVLRYFWSFQEVLGSRLFWYWVACCLVVPTILFGKAQTLSWLDGFLRTLFFVPLLCFLWPIAMILIGAFLAPYLPTEALSVFLATFWLALVPHEQLMELGVMVAYCHDRSKHHPAGGRCWMCMGSGICQACQGSGCNHCGGTGRCWSCKGTGWGKVS